MTLEQLRIFVAVAEREHMTKAAQALNVTQSAASAAIATLETQHGVALFHRVGRRIELTEPGRQFLEEARAVLGRAASAELTLAEFGGLKRGTLKLVASQTITGYWLPRHLAAFRQRYPDVAVDLAIANTGGAAERVHDGAAELGFVEGQIDDPALISWEVAQDQMTLVAAPGTAPPAIDKAWLQSARWIMREQGSGTRSTFEDVLRARGLDPATLDIALTLPSNEAVRSAVEAGAGIAALSSLVVLRAVRAGMLAELKLDLPRRPFFGLRHKERYSSRAAKALLDLITENGR
ncbi:MULTISPECIES: LysR family transcriptional regulator [unclassified Beijerinckia]|uniref:LysR family transcriptional regulator n=1 Tax=unclassified Beijerinckia TaxID=2638183 RepID=UPI0008995248|nr:MULTISPECIES: LysR family transcriptional regulator [unclassified Beijerinckia]MDH7794962.1 DNA-binding transcriptional LysR family regulator [Beijerinckia sp. GAS462]SEB82071.1 DNA-binding transcriptional regulator, LysR family [Beijerinckia sp. 28-YEA-48]